MPLDAGTVKISAIDDELRRRAADSLFAFVGFANPRFQFYLHCRLLIDVLERVASGEIKRLLVQLPPRHSKSELFTRLFPAYYLKRNPSHFVGLNSYSADLAYTLSRAARENYIQCGGIVKDDAAAVKHWETPEGGGLWAAGVGGSITGKGANLALIDDPLKNSEEADSEIIREKQKEWYRSTFHTRLEPDAAIIVIQTRWHEDDLTGWLLSEEHAETSEPEKWHIVCLPAIAEPVSGFPDTCSIEPDFREEGEALCPERYDEAALRRIRAKGERNFEALYQQHPTSREGLFFHVTQIKFVDAAPVEGRRVRGWDKAGTQGDGDYTAGIKMLKANDGLFYIEDVVRGQWNTADRDKQIRQIAELDSRSVKQVGEQEPGSGGKESAENFIRLLAGFPVVTEKVSGSKESRADPFSSQVNAGNVRVVRGPWNKDYIEELRTFSHGKHDDQVDASSLAFNELNGGARFEIDRFEF